MLLTNLLTTFVVFSQLGPLAPLALLLDSALGSPTVDPAKWRPAGGSFKEGAFVAGQVCVNGERGEVG